MGVVIVALGKKAYVPVWAENHYDYNLIDNDLIWIAFCTASIAAGFLCLRIRCIGRNKKDGGTF